jgi:hypothetical protein
MAEVLGINRRTIERWNAGNGAPRESIQNELRRLAIYPVAREIGDVLRQMAQGVSLDEIEQGIRNQQVAVRRVRASLGKFDAIAILAAPED